MSYTGPRNEIIERVAKALRDSDYGVGSTEPFEDYLEGAYAAICALRAPTREMLAAGATAIDNATDSTSDSYSTYIITDGSDYALPGWQAMIDAALFKDAL